MQQSSIGLLQSSGVSGSQGIGTDDIGADGDAISKIGTEEINLQDNLMGCEGGYSLLGRQIVGEKKDEAQASCTQKNVSAVFAEVEPIFFVKGELAPKSLDSRYGCDGSKREQTTHKVGEEGSPGRSGKSRLNSIEKKPTGGDVDGGGEGGQNEADLDLCRVPAKWIESLV